MIANIVEYFASSLLSVLTLDLEYFEATVPITKEIINIITVTDAVNMFLHQSLMVGGLPFELKQPNYNAETEAAMREACDIAAGRIETKSFHSIADLMGENGVSMVSYTAVIFTRYPP